MTARELIERLKDFNLDDEVVILDGISLDFEKVRVGNSPNTIKLEAGIPDLSDIVSNIQDSVNNIYGALYGLDDIGKNKYLEDIEDEVDSLYSSIDDLQNFC